MFARRQKDVGPPDDPLTNNPGDPGLGGFLQADSESDDPVIGDADYDLQTGTFKVPTLRNVAVTAPTGPTGSPPP